MSNYNDYMKDDIGIPLALIGRIKEKANRFLLLELKNHNIAGLAPSHGDILWALFKNKRLSMKRLAEFIDRDKSTVTALVNKLIKLGYIQKTPDSHDSRITLISLTKKGRGLKDDLIDISEKLLSKVYRNISAKEKAVLITLLTKINDNW